jgi:ribulose-5-phosphate 4-epimerase/fuculose-1-phosphate aldolase
MNPPVSSPAIKVVNSVREQVSAEEWQARVDLAACYRLTALYGMTEMVANHISCRVPGTTDQFLINPYGMLYEEIDASCLIKVDVEGNTLLNASDYDVNVAGFVIHSAIHMAKHEVDCVAHTHTPAGMAVSAMECGLLPLAQTSMRFLHIAYHDFEGIADNVDERERLVRDLGDNEAMILPRPAGGRPHGACRFQRAVPPGAGLPGAGHGAVVQHQADLSAARRAGRHLRADAAKTRPVRPQWQSRLAGAAAQARPPRSVLSKLSNKRRPGSRLNFGPPCPQFERTIFRQIADAWPWQERSGASDEDLHSRC